jgi:hypothetical protein
MGNFYVNFVVKDAEPKQVADTLGRAGRRAVVTPSKGSHVVAFEEEADSQATNAILEVGCLLSRELSRPVFAALNHDDDVLCYWLFEGGELADSYNSAPGAFDEDHDAPPFQVGDATKLCATLNPAAVAADVEAILRGDFVFAVDRHLELAEALGLPDWSVGFGYEYVKSGELEDELDGGELIHVNG